MAILTRRNFVKSAAAASALPLLGRAAFADEPLKVGYIYLGPVGDFGWTWAHEKGRKAMVEHFKGKVVADESPAALRAQTGEANLEDAFVKLIGTDEGLAA